MTRDLGGCVTAFTLALLLCGCGQQTAPKSPADDSEVSGKLDKAIKGATDDPDFSAKLAKDVDALKALNKASNDFTAQKTVADFISECSKHGAMPDWKTRGKIGSLPSLCQTVFWGIVSDYQTSNKSDPTHYCLPRQFDFDNDYELKDATLKRTLDSLKSHPEYGTMNVKEGVFKVLRSNFHCA